MSLQPTPRQIQCLYWLCQGKTQEEIANITGLKLRTVKFHCDSLKDRLGFKTLAQSIYWAGLTKIFKDFVPK